MRSGTEDEGAPPSHIVQRVQVEAALCVEFGEALFELVNVATIRMVQKIGLFDHEHFREILSPALRYARCVRGVGEFDEGDSHALGPWRRSGRVCGSGLYDCNTAPFFLARDFLF